MVRVAINGYGRIGRVAHRVILEHHTDDIEVVGINAGSSTDLKGWMYLLKYDSVYGFLPLDLSVREEKKEKDGLLGHLIVEDKEIPVYSQKDPLKLPWKALKVDVVIDATGVFETEEELKMHLKAGARTVVLASPAKDDTPTYVLSVNHDQYKGEKIISNVSCTTNCISPVEKVIHEAFVIEKAMMTTIHGYTADQRLQDGGHHDYRRARAAGLNIIPTSTGATKAFTRAYPALDGLFGGLAIRVPVPVGSLADCTCVVSKNTTKEAVNDAFRKAAALPLYQGILAVTEDPLVSSDIIGNPHSAIVDLNLTQVVGGNLVKVIAWYDNEYGYANRLVEEVIMVGKGLA